MPLLFRYPLRCILPLLMLLVVLVSSGFVYVFDSVVRTHIIEDEVLHNLASGMQRRQTRMEDYLREGKIERVRREVEIIVFDNPTDNVVVVNAQQEIISASNQAWVGLPIAKAPLLPEGKQRLGKALAMQGQGDKGGEFISSDRQTVYAYSPLTQDDEHGQPRLSGLLYHEHDLRKSKAIGQKSVRQNALWFLGVIVFLALGVWLFLYFVFYQRVRLLVKTMDRFGMGDNMARSALPGNDELATLSTALDSMLGQREAAEKHIREQASLLKRLTDGLPVLIAYVDKDARYRFVNQEFENWFYLKPEQVVGRHVQDLLSEQGVSELVNHVSLALSGQVVEYDDSVPIVNNGMRQFHATVIPHFENGSGVIGCFLLAQDITQQRQEQHQIMQAKEQWERTFDSIKDEIITVQDKELRILQANSATAVFFGIPREEIIGRRCYELFRGEKIPCNECPVFEVFQDAKSHSTELYNEQFKKNLLVSISPMMDAKGEFIGIVHSAKDITAFKQLEQRLRQAQKMEAIGTLAGGIAHDFNNILTPIFGYSELMLERLAIGSEERGLVQEIMNSSIRAKELVKQILTFSRQSEQHRQPVQIHLIVKEALKLLRSSIPTTIAINQHVIDCGLVMADPTQIHQILMNLCTNAYHAMRESGGELNVSLSEVELSERDYLDNLVLLPGPHVKLTVRDTGCGMTKELQERIFEPYFTTKKLGDGTGLGLSTVHGIVQSHQGHITLYSEPGKGTEFHVYFPQVVSKHEELVTEAGSVVAMPRGSGTILVVDDEPAVGELLRQELLSLGYEVVLCASSTEAFETFQQDMARIALVLTDMTMPVMNGAELTRRIKQLCPATPVVLCTGFSEIMDEQKAKRMGIDGFLLKPVIKRQLALTIFEVLRKKGANGSVQ